MKECGRREENKGWEGLKVEEERRAKSVWKPAASAKNSFTMYNQIQDEGKQNELEIFDIHFPALVRGGAKKNKNSA